MSGGTKTGYEKGGKKGYNNGRAGSRKYDIITKEMFYGEEPAENAEIFVNTLQKTRAQHIKKVQDRELILAGTSNPEAAGRGSYNESGDENMGEDLFSGPKEKQ